MARLLESEVTTVAGLAHELKVRSARADASLLAFESDQGARVRAESALIDGMLAARVPCVVHHDTAFCLTKESEGYRLRCFPYRDAAAVVLPESFAGDFNRRAI